MRGTAPTEGHSAAGGQPKPTSRSTRATPVAIRQHAISPGRARGVILAVLALVLGAAGFAAARPLAVPGGAGFAPLCSETCPPLQTTPARQARRGLRARSRTCPQREPGGPATSLARPRGRVLPK